MSAYRFNPLAFPTWRRPGFNPEHVAVANGGACYLSAVATGAGTGTGTFINLLNGKRGTLGSTPAATIDGVIGPAVNYTVNNQFSRFTGTIATTANITFALICRLSLNTGPVFNTTSGAGGYRITFSGNSFAIYDNASTTLASQVTASTNIPYFSIVSYNGTTAFFAQVSLITGQIQATSSTGALSPSAGNGSLNIAWDGGDTPGMAIAAVAYFPQSLSPSEILQWAADPWSFWYPRRTDGPDMSVGSSGVVVSYPVGNSMIWL
jgi:hypothetical protein